MGFDDEFTGQSLIDLVISIEAQISRYKAGATPLGSAVINLCEDTVARDRASQVQN